MSRLDYQQTWRRALATGSALLLWPWRAEAHLVTTGLGPVYDGIGHLLVTPEDLLPVLALALLAGLRGAGVGRRVLCVLPIAWLTGGGVGLLAQGLPAFPSPALSFLVLGTLVAADLRLPPQGSQCWRLVLAWCTASLTVWPCGRQALGPWGCWALRLPSVCSWPWWPRSWSRSSGRGRGSSYGWPAVGLPPWAC